MKACRFALAVFLLALAIGGIIPLRGQFQVQSIFPANGTTGVDTAATFSITFSQPLDTSRHFLYPEGFFVNLILLPDSLVGYPDSISLSADLKTVYIHNLHLHADTQYWLLIANAYSTGGDSLAIPFNATFSTAPTIPSGIVDGRVLNASSSDVIGSVILLFETYPFSDEDGMVIPATVVTDPIGNFSISHVPAGTYWVAALKNFYLSYDGGIEFKSNPALGFPDYDYDHVIDSIWTVAGGWLNMNPFFMKDAYLQTVQSGEQVVQPVAQAWQTDAELTYAMGTPNAQGESNFWFYNYYSPGTQTHRQWGVLGDDAWWADIGNEPDDIYPLPAGWLDSDSALTIAEAEGGFAFRQMYPNAVIFAGVGAFSTSDRNRKAFRLPLPRADTPENGPGLGRTVLSVWQIEYYVPNDTPYFGIALDAVSGENLSAPCTAYPAFQYANGVAGQWMSDAQLYRILSIAGIDTLGNGIFWQFDFYSQVQQMLHSVVTFGRLPINDWDYGMPPDTLVVPPNWIDCDQALQQAELAGGADYRQQYPGTGITTQLTRWRNSPHPEKTVWIFTYQAPGVFPEIFIVDAHSGQVVSLRDTGNGEIPEKFVLFRPYPNPFNPETRIPFSIPTTGKVDLRVYNVLGQLVDHPVSLNLAAGTHEVVWKPTANLPAGIYWIRLSWKNQQKIAKVVLLK
ncbi:MAG: hypothetical protein Kow0037_31650 [Calditrichia bacterium]